MHPPPPAAPPAPTPPTEEELQAKKAKQREKNKKYRLRKKEKKKIEEEKRVEEAKSPQVAHIVTSGSEEDSPRKTPMASRAHRVLGAVAKKSLFQSLVEMSDEEAVELGQEINKCYRVKVARRR